jgi:hypothetical protein
MDGDGDERNEVMPFVWMPGGTGRLILDATGGGGCGCAEGMTGAMAPALRCLTAASSDKDACPLYHSAFDTEFLWADCH